MTDQEIDGATEELYQEYWDVHVDMMNQGHNPIEIAAIIIAQGLILYKTALSAEEYDEMVDSISDLRYNIKELKPDQENLH
jgi:hypothetical protein